MINIDLKVSNINNCLVFYKSLLGVGPTKLTGISAHFLTDRIRLNLVESDRVERDIHHLVLNSEDFQVVFNRVRRFIEKRTFGISCKVLSDHFSARDPEGNQWLVHIPSADLSSVRSEECYLESFKF